MTPSTTTPHHGHQQHSSHVDEEDAHSLALSSSPDDHQSKENEQKDADVANLAKAETRALGVVRVSVGLLLIGIGK